MAISEACEVWINQRIEEEQENGTPHPEIGRKLGLEIAKYFEVQIASRTIEQRSRRIATNVATSPTSQEHEENVEKPPSMSKKPSTENRPKCSCGKLRERAKRKDGSIFYLSTCSACRKSKPRKANTPSLGQFEVTEALELASIAIVNLSRIRADDPKREDGFDKVVSWINSQTNGEGYVRKCL